MELPCYILDEAQAETVRTYIGHHGAQIEPRYIEGGDHAGYHAIPLRIIQDEDFAEHWVNIESLPWALLEIEKAWPENEPGLLSRMWSALVTAFTTSDIDGQI